VSSSRARASASFGVGVGGRGAFEGGGASRAGLRRVERLAGLVEEAEAEDLGLLQGAAEVAVRVEDAALALDLLARVARHGDERPLDLVEPGGHVAARDLHPEVREALGAREPAVGDLLDHALRVVTDRVEGLGDGAVPLAHLEAAELIADHLVEKRRLRERARDGGDASDRAVRCGRAAPRRASAAPP
jgi:hypothetical protein